MSETHNRSFKIEFNKQNHCPPFYCCIEAKQWDIEESCLKDMDTFKKFLRVGPISYHFHRHNLQRINFANTSEGHHVAFGINLYEADEIYKEILDVEDTAVEWHVIKEEFWLPTQTCQMVPDDEEDAEKQAKVPFYDCKHHDCHGWGLGKVAAESLHADDFLPTGLVMDVICRKHFLVFRIEKYEVGGPVVERETSNAFVSEDWSTSEEDDTIELITKEETITEEDSNEEVSSFEEISIEEISSEEVSSSLDDSTEKDTLDEKTDVEDDDDEIGQEQLPSTTFDGKTDAEEDDDAIGQEQLLFTTFDVGDASDEES